MDNAEPRIVANDGPLTVSGGVPPVRPTSWLIERNISDLAKKVG